MMRFGLRSCREVALGASHSRAHMRGLMEREAARGVRQAWRPYRTVRSIGLIPNDGTGQQCRLRRSADGSRAGLAFARIVPCEPLEKACGLRVLCFLG